MNSRKSRDLTSLLDEEEIHRVVNFREVSQGRMAVGLNPPKAKVVRSNRVRGAIFLKHLPNLYTFQISGFV